MSAKTGSIRVLPGARRYHRQPSLPSVTYRETLRELHGCEDETEAAMELIHTCYRITDIDRSVAFYEVLGFEERGRMPIREEAINVFMGLPGDDDRLELTYNFGVDSYELGTGYGHIAVTVEDLDGTLERLADQGIEPERPPYQVREGGSRLCFVRDPDGYRIELIERA
jgi:lactoylglutathione lyase